MTLLYSGALSPNIPQTDPALSLGGYVSSTTVRNGLKNGVFSPLRMVDIYNKATQTRLIVLKNILGIAANSISIWIDNDTNAIATYKGALVLPATDNCGNELYEKIFADTDIPYSATFQNIVTEGNAMNLSTLASGRSIGIWLQRQIDTTNVNYFDNTGKFNANTCNLLQAAAIDPTNFYNNKLESISIKVQYT